MLLRLKRNKLKEDIEKGLVDISVRFETDYEMAALRKIFTKVIYIFY